MFLNGLSKYFKQQAQLLRLCKNVTTLASIMPTFSAPRYRKQPDSPKGVRAVAALPPAVGVMYDRHLAFNPCTCAILVYCDLLVTGGKEISD